MKTYCVEERPEYLNYGTGWLFPEVASDESESRVISNYKASRIATGLAIHTYSA
jgi:hypothetical protein